MMPEPLNLKREEFEQIVVSSIKSIPQKFLEKLHNVEIVVEDYPSFYQLAKIKLANKMSLLGLYEGVPQTRRGVYYSSLPDKITIFKKPIEALCQNAKDVKSLVSDTVAHEIAHHFGLDEEKIRQNKSKSKKTQQ